MENKPSGGRFIAALLFFATTAGIAILLLLTALVVWLMLKWEEEADQPHSSRWIVLIAYMMGLSIGVHILNLLTIPALVRGKLSRVQGVALLCIYAAFCAVQFTM